jgi:hypothetical protein
VWLEERVPLYGWRFFPSSAIEESTFVAAQDRQAFEAARRRVAHILFNARFWMLSERQFKVEPMFRFADGDLPDPMVETAETQEIEKYVTEDYGT